MMFKLAEELRDSYKVLVTTTTKIYTPLKEQYDFICTDASIFSTYIFMKEKGVYILGLGVNKENKILGLNEKHLAALAPHFDYILMEADGAKAKALKGWNECEPVIFSKTTKTVGIIDIQSWGIPICEDKVHRSDIFCEITGAQQGEIVEIQHLCKVILHPKGLFKGAQGEKILFINKAEEPKEVILAKLLARQVSLMHKGLLNRLIMGSLKTNIYI